MCEHSPDIPIDVPVEHQVAAEHIRAHLVYLRGGAPFLSPADAMCLVQWLDAGVSVPRILAALERCAASRRKNNARTRFSLRAARRHLDKPPLTRVDPPVGLGSHPLHPLAEELANLPQTKQLAGSLLAIIPSDDAVVNAVALCRDHLQRRWQDLGTDERATRIEAAAETLGDLRSLVDAPTLHALAEEIARERFRSVFPCIDTARIEGLFA